MPFARPENEYWPLALVVTEVLPLLTLTPLMPAPPLVAMVPDTEYVVVPPVQAGNLKSAMRVCQLPLGRYMPTNQKVQSSTGSTVIW